MTDNSKIEIKIPPLGESISQATIGAFLKSEGAFAKADEEIVELETEKVNQPLYAPAAGIVHWQVQVGASAQVGQVIGWIEPKEAPKELPPKPSKEVKAPPKTQQPAEPIRQSADAYLQQLSSEPSPTAPPAPTSEERRQKMSKLRRVIASRLVEVKNQTAMLTTFNEIDMSAIIAVREKEQESFQKRHGVKLGFMSFFVKASIAALQQYPAINARLEGDEMVFPSSYDIGIAVGTDKGLMVPVLRQAEKMSYAQIEQALKTFADKARAGTIAVDDLQGGTFTITNGGVYGSMLSTPILNPPQSGILGMHAIQKRAVVIGDEIAIRPIMYVALSYDHRIVDGKESISFLMHIKRNLEEPTRLLLDL